MPRTARKNAANTATGVKFEFPSSSPSWQKTALCSRFEISHDHSVSEAGQPAGSRRHYAVAAAAVTPRLGESLCHAMFNLLFRTFDRIQENRVVTASLSSSEENPPHYLRSNRSQSAERRQQKKRSDISKLEAGSSATLTRGFHLPHTSSKSLWQRVFVGSSSGSHSGSSRHHDDVGLHHGLAGGGVGSNNNGPESLPCSWSIIDLDNDKSPPPTLRHIKQNSFDSGIHTSDSSEYSIKV